MAAGKMAAKVVITTGKIAVGGIAGALIDGAGLPVVVIKEVGRSVGRDALNIITNKDVPKSLLKLVLDPLKLSLGVCLSVLGGAA